MNNTEKMITIKAEDVEKLQKQEADKSKAEKPKEPEKK